MQSLVMSDLQARLDDALRRLETLEQRNLLCGKTTERLRAQILGLKDAKLAAVNGLALAQEYLTRATMMLEEAEHSLHTIEENLTTPP